MPVIVIKMADETLKEVAEITAGLATLSKLIPKKWFSKKPKGNPPATLSDILKVHEYISKIQDYILKFLDLFEGTASGIKGVQRNVGLQADNVSKLMEVVRILSERVDKIEAELKAKERPKRKSKK